MKPIHNIIKYNIDWWNEMPSVLCSCDSFGPFKGGCKYGSVHLTPN